MDSKPRWLTCTPKSNAMSSSSSPTSQLYCRDRVLGCDPHTRGHPFKLDSDSQSPRFNDSSKNQGGPEGRHPAWRRPSRLSSASASCDGTWTESGGSRSKQCYRQRGSETQQGMYTEQDADRKRSALSGTGRASCSGDSRSSLEGGHYSSADSPWLARSPPSRSSTSSSSSSSSSSSEGFWSRRELRKRSDRSLSGPVGHAAGLSESRTTSLFTSQNQERVTSCYAQGARPKEGVSSSRMSGSYLHRLPSDYQPSWLSHDSCSDASEQPRESSVDPRVRTRTSRSGDWTDSLPERSPGVSPLYRPRRRPSDLAERHGTKPLLSRLASSMSSTLFSRRSSQDSGGSGSAAVPNEAGSSLQRGGLGSLDDPSPGLPFLRRRRQSTPPVPWGNSTESEPESPRASGSWLSSSLRNRCAPLFPRRRREGRDETALSMSATAFPNSRCPPLTTHASGINATEEEDEEEEPRGAGAAPPHTGGDQDLSGITRSLLRLSMPSPLEGASGNAALTIDMMAPRRIPSEEQREEKPTSSRDPERVKKIQESLLLEDSDEEEGELCRICQMGHNSPPDPLIEPCQCTGSLQYVHQECMKKWLLAKISSGSSLEAITTCELCREKLQLDIEDFDINELHRTHERSEYEFISCGLYLVVLLHLCEQRFSDTLGIANEVGFFNLARTLREHMDSLERAYRESEEEEARQNSPSVDFGDSDEEERC
ncbi:E3 ubiquitin-protein ligase MARCHF7-like [Paramormyrops kingsleyae]|uniref:E3 ubiquitin-protein ligase MARCHF7-like n=1 Tax=Paramormyrops kingsleyae TaxID=1676925 RepID=UPI003B96F611